MYTERTPEQQKTRRNRFIALAVFVCALLVALGILLNIIFASAKDQGAASIRSTILDAAMQCAAIEGSFPTNLAIWKTTTTYALIMTIMSSSMKCLRATRFPVWW